MISQKYSRFVLTEHRKVMSGVDIAEEGKALVYDKEGLDTVVRPSTGAEGEIFAGISLTRNSPPATLPWVGENNVPASLTMQLPRTPLSSQIMVKLNGIKAKLVASTPAAAGEVQLVKDVLTFHVDDEKKAYFVQMQYTPSVQEAAQVLGAFPIGGLAAQAQGVVGVTNKGDIATSFFDPSADFQTALKVRLGADGRFTTGGQGTELDNVVIVTAPSADNATLVLRLNV